MGSLGSSLEEDSVSTRRLLLERLRRLDIIKIWRSRRFGKTLVCDMLAEYYDLANNEDKRNEVFGETDIMKKNLTTNEMGKYLVLSLNFSKVSSDSDVQKNFRKYINNAVQDFSEKYVEAKLLKKPIEIDPEDCLSSLQQLFSVVNDECDAFINRLIDNIDTSKSDLERKQYKKTIVSRSESMILNWGNVIKGGTVGGTIARMFITGVTPGVTLSDGISGLNMVQDLTFDPQLEGPFGFTEEEVSNGLQMVTPAALSENE